MIDTPLGPMVAGAVDQGLCLLKFADRRMLETQVKRLERLLKQPLVPGDHPHLKRVSEELDRYFAGRLEAFTVPVVLRGTPSRNVCGSSSYESLTVRRARMRSLPVG